MKNFIILNSPKGEKILKVTFRVNLSLIWKATKMVFLIAAAGAVVYGIAKVVCWLCRQLWSAICFGVAWSCDNWQWLLLIIMAVLLGVFLTKLNWRNRRVRRGFAWTLAALVLLLTCLMGIRGCCRKEKENPQQIEAQVIDDTRSQVEKSFADSLDKLRIIRAYFEADPYWGIQFNTDNSKFSEGDDAELALKTWKKHMGEYLRNKDLTNDQMAVIIAYAMVCGQNGFPKSRVLSLVNEGHLDKVGQAMLTMYNQNGEPRKINNEKRRYYWVLGALWEGTFKVEDLKEFYCVSYSYLPLDKAYDRQGKGIFDQSLIQYLKRKTTYPLTKDLLKDLDL